MRNCNSNKIISNSSTDISDPERYLHVQKNILSKKLFYLTKPKKNNQSSKSNKWKYVGGNFEYRRRYTRQGDMSLIEEGSVGNSYVLQSVDRQIVKQDFSDKFLQIY